MAVICICPLSLFPFLLHLLFWLFGFKSEAPHDIGDTWSIHVGLFCSVVFFYLEGFEETTVMTGDIPTTYQNIRCTDGIWDLYRIERKGFNQEKGPNEHTSLIEVRLWQMSSLLYVWWTATGVKYELIKDGPGAVILTPPCVHSVEIW